MQHGSDVITNRNPAKYCLSKTMLQNRVQQIPQVANDVLTVVIYWWFCSYPNVVRNLTWASCMQI